MPEYGRLSAIAAKLIDRMYLYEPKNWIERLWHGFKLRTVYITLFLPLALVDLITSGFTGLFFGLGSFFLSDAAQEFCIQQQQKFSNIFGENFFTLLASPLGLYQVKLITFYFIPESTSSSSITSGGHYYKADDVVIRYPETTKELQDIIVSAAQKGLKVIPVGAGLSQGKQFIPAGQNGIVVDLKKLNAIQIDSQEKTALVGAGVRWFDLQLAADKHKLAIKVMQASNIFSVGGSIGTNIHGWNHQTGTLSNTIMSMTIVNAKGEIQTLTPKDELFHYITGGLGLFGIVIQVKLKLTDNEWLLERAYEIPLDDYLCYFKEQVLPDDNIRMHLYRLSIKPGALLTSGIAVSYIKKENSQPVVTPNLVPESAVGTRFNNIAINAARHFDFIRDYYWQNECSNLLSNTSAAMTTNQFMQPPINAMLSASTSEAEWLQEFFLPAETLVSYLQELRQLLMQNDVVLINASIRFVRHNAQPLFSYTSTGDRYAIVLCFNQSLQQSEVLKTAKWIRQAQKLAVEAGGSWYLPYQHFASRENFKQAYPNAAKVMDLKKQCDPNHVFSSGLFEKFLMGPSKTLYGSKQMTPQQQTSADVSDKQTPHFPPPVMRNTHQTTQTNVLAVGDLAGYREIGH